MFTDHLQRFIETLHADPSLRMPLVDFIGGLRGTLPSDERPGAKRALITECLAILGHPVGVGADGRLWVSGLSFDPPKRIAWKVVAGRLVAEKVTK